MNVESHAHTDHKLTQNNTSKVDVLSECGDLYEVTNLAAALVQASIYLLYMPTCLDIHSTLYLRLRLGTMGLLPASRSRMGYW